MKIPIFNALFESNLNYLKYFKKNKKNLTIKNLDFLPADKEKFTTLKLIPEIDNSESATVIINATNEIFVDEFLKNHIHFNDISAYLKLVLKDKDYIKTSNMSSNSIKNIYKINDWAKNLAYQTIKKNKNTNA
jgi:1-deoxy-D-xylulose 5-phosphate reductoisomerase